MLYIDCVVSGSYSIEEVVVLTRNKFQGGKTSTPAVDILKMLFLRVITLISREHLELIYHIWEGAGLSLEF